MALYNFFSSANGHTSADVVKKDFKDCPPTFDYIWVLGKKYHPLHDLEDLRTAVRSKIWLSYRSGFQHIAGTGPKTDRYWGCMIRCGQMVMAQALIFRHLGKDWVWRKGVDDPVYAEVLRMFQDRKDCPYSIHQIAQMGVSEGKAIGHWFGPNTIAQVLRKLSGYDEWSSMAVHVAFDNTVIRADIRTLCRYHPEPVTPSPFVKSYQTVWYTDCATRLCPRWQRPSSVRDQNSWRPMLLFIPLRLGLSSFNPIYSSSMKSMLMLKQSLGVLGGKPKHAVWFIGYTGDELICLDPHDTQSAVDLEKKFDDSSYHVKFSDSKRMPLSQIDPSIALCFFLESEHDFEDWCNQVQQVFQVPENQTLFEILAIRPKHWPMLELRPDLNCSNCSMEYCFLEEERKDDISDEDFESLEHLVYNPENDNI